jgi:error-prone DNA polymerase
MGARLISVRGYVQSDENVIHVVVQHLEDRTDALARLANAPTAIELSHADELLRPAADHRSRHPRDVRIIPKSRDFH